MRRTVRQRSGKRKRATREGGRERSRGGKVRGQELEIKEWNKGRKGWEKKKGREEDGNR